MVRGPVQAREAPRRAPASFLQEYSYNTARDGLAHDGIPLMVRFTGAFDRAALYDALLRLIARHAVLRTTLQRRESLLEQLIWSPRPPEITYIDLSGAPQRERHTFERLLLREAWAPFDLRAGEPLFRATIVRLALRDHILLLVAHHSIADGWSREIIFDELEHLYAAAISRAEPSLTGLRLEFSEYATAERALRRPALERYWCEHFAHRGGPLQMTGPSDRRRADVTLFMRPLPLVSPAAVRRLTAFASHHGASLATALTAAVATTLRPYVDGDVVLGLLYVNRPNPELQAMVGCLFDVLPVRITITPESTFQQILIQSRDALTSAMSHFIPFGLLQQAVRATSAPPVDLHANVNLTPYRPVPTCRTFCDVHNRSVTVKRLPLTYFHPKRRIPLGHASDLLDTTGSPALLGCNLFTDQTGGIYGILQANANALSSRDLNALARQLACTLRHAHLHPQRPLEL